MEQKKVTYTGVDTEDVTEQLEQGNAKLAEKGWREYRVDMLSSSAVRVTYVRGELEEDEELPPGRRGRISPCGGFPPRQRKEAAMVIGLIVGIVFIVGVLYFQHRNKDQ